MAGERQVATLRCSSGRFERNRDLSIIGDRASPGSGKPEPKTANNHTGKEYETPDNARPMI